MRIIVPQGTTSYITPAIFIQDATTGAGIAVDHTTGITGGYKIRGAASVAVTVDEDGASESSFSSPSTAAKLKIYPCANMPTGNYVLHLHNTHLASGESVDISLAHASILTVNLSIQLSDPMRGVGSPAAIPNFPGNGTSGGLAILNSNGDVDCDVKRWRGNPPASLVDADKVSVSTDAVRGSEIAAIRLEEMFKSILKGTVDNTTFIPTTTAFETDQIDDDAAEWTSQALLWTSGANVGTTVFVTAYDYQNSKVQLTVSTMETAPSHGDTFLRMGRAA